MNCVGGQILIRFYSINATIGHPNTPPSNSSLLKYVYSLSSLIAFSLTLISWASSGRMRLSALRKPSTPLPFLTVPSSEPHIPVPRARKVHWKTFFAIRSSGFISYKKREAPFAAWVQCAIFLKQAQAVYSLLSIILALTPRLISRNPLLSTTLKLSTNSLREDWPPTTSALC